MWSEPVFFFQLLWESFKVFLWSLATFSLILCPDLKTDHDNKLYNVDLKMSKKDKARWKEEESAKSTICDW